jgi:hypothetical protein
MRTTTEAMREVTRETTEWTGEQTSARKADPAPTPQAPPSTGAAPPEKPKASRRRKMLLGALSLLILACALWFGIPWVQTALNTVSTDDAYVNSHVTFVAARVRGQVARVLVDDMTVMFRRAPGGEGGRRCAAGCGATVMSCRS